VQRSLARDTEQGNQTSRAESRLCNTPTSAEISAWCSGRSLFSSFPSRKCERIGTVAQQTPILVEAMEQIFEKVCRIGLIDSFEQTAEDHESGPGTSCHGRAVRWNGHCARSQGIYLVGILIDDGPVRGIT